MLCGRVHATARDDYRGLRVLRIEVLCATPPSGNARVCETETVPPNRQDGKHAALEFTGDEFGYECGVLKLKIYVIMKMSMYYNKVFFQ
jgi:hypothetical protein